MPKIIDLTATLGDPRLPVFHLFPKVILEPIHVHEVHGRSNTKLTMPIHVGTHVDPPYHFVAGGMTIDDLPLQKVMGKAVRLDLRNTATRNSAITAEQIQSVVNAQNIYLKGKIAVLHTGWAETAFFQPNFYVDNPYLAIEASKWLSSHGVKAVGLDHPIDAGAKQAIQPHPGDCPNHRHFLENGIPLIENLINLETFADLEFQLIAMPIKIYRCDGAPARVIAVLTAGSVFSQA